MRVLPALSEDASPAPVRELTVPAEVCRMRLETHEQQVFATGGKEHLLRIWDVESGTNLFREKNVCLSILLAGQCSLLSVITP